MKKLVFIFLLLNSLTNNAYTQKKICQLEGEVVDRASTHLLLFKATAHHLNPLDTIEIIDGKFQYEFGYTSVEAYQLIFKDELERGSWRPILLFPAPHIKLKLHVGEKFLDNQLVGDPYFTLRQEKLLHEENHVYPQLNTLWSQVDSFQQMGDTLQAADAQIEFDLALDAYLDSHFNYMKESSNPLAYYYLYDFMRNNPSFNSNYFDSCQKVYKALSKVMPNHPYTPLIGDMLFNKELLGQKVANFKAQDLNGKIINLEDQLSGQLTLIIFWGSWCGPCIFKTRKELVPIYESYHEQGLEYIGIAREFGNVQKLEAALKREQYPWDNFLDLDDFHQVWAQFNQQSTAGWTLVLDKAGIILAVDPSEAELKELIKTNL